MKTDQLVFARSGEIAAKLGYGRAGTAGRPKVVTFAPEQIDTRTASGCVDQIGFEPRECGDADEGRMDDDALAGVGKKLPKRFVILFTADNEVVRVQRDWARGQDALVLLGRAWGH